MLSPLPASSRSTSPGVAVAGRLERTVLGAAMSVMAFVIERRVAQARPRGRSLASS